MVVSKKSIVETHAVLATVMWAIYLRHIGYKGRCTFCRIWVWVKTLSTLEEHHDINDSLYAVLENQGTRLIPPIY